MLNFDREIRAHLESLESATSQLADSTSGSAQTEAALSAARNALATIETLLRTPSSKQ